MIDIKYVTQIVNGKVKISDQYCSLKYANDEELVDLVIELIEKEYAFTDEPAGWSAAAVVQDLKDKGLVKRSFTAITWRGPGDYRNFEIA